LGKIDRIDPAGLARHERAVARDLEILDVPRRNWPAKIEDATGQPVLDGPDVGAGMNGIAAAGSLMFKGVRNIRVIERSRPGQEGPWLTFARMDTLRFAKTLTGPALGVPSLTFRAWCEAKYGLDAWRRFTRSTIRPGLSICPGCSKCWVCRSGTALRCRRSEPVGPSCELRSMKTARVKGVLARRVVLATGRAGAGGVFWPDYVDRALVPDLAAHTMTTSISKRLPANRSPYSAAGPPLGQCGDRA